MHVAKRAVQALCVASSFPSGAVAGRSSVIISPSDSARKSSTKYSSFASVASGRRPPSSAFASPFASDERNRRGLAAAAAKNMSPSSNDGVPQVKNRVALLQLPVTHDKSQNVRTAREYILKAREAGARLCVLPEIWNGPYATAAFPEYAEALPDVGDSLVKKDEANDRWGESSAMLMEMAKSTNMYVVGGSVPESCEGKIYNTCLVANPSGVIVGKHRKVHLFDVDVPGGIRFKESETLTGGEGVTYFDVEEDDDDDDEGGLGRIGVGICYDIRFPEYALLLTQTHRCGVLVYPGAFNLTTGPAHWELLQRARAVDGQCFVLTASPARMPPPPEDGDATARKYPHYSAWGHSTVVSPWGEVVATCDEKPSMVVADLDMGKVEEMRTAIPTMGQKRHNLYRLIEGDGAEK